MNPRHLSPDVQELLLLFSNHDVRSVLVGGIAVIYHGYARLTGDVDLYYDPSKENAHRLWDALVEFWGGSVPVLDGPEELADPELVVQFGRPPNRIDLIAGLRAVSFAEAWEGRVRESFELRGTTVAVGIMGLDHLRLAKQDAGRPRSPQGPRRPRPLAAGTVSPPGKDACMVDG